MIEKRGYDRLVGVIGDHGRSPSRAFSPRIKFSRPSDAYDNSLVHTVNSRLINGAPPSNRMICLNEANLPKKNLVSRFRSVYLLESLPGPSKSSANAESAHIQPTRILQAPNMEDDFYLNLLDWSTFTNRIAVGLGRDIMCWDEQSGRLDQIISIQSPDIVASLAWQPRCANVAMGSKNGRLELVDVERALVTQKFKAHCNTRTGTISWNPLNENLFCSGGRDKLILHHDIRQKGVIAISKSHTQEICGLKWDPTGNRLASGGNDNKLFVWDPRSPNVPVTMYDKHVAAVKAIAWSPHTAGLLASGGGTADRTLRFWNTRASSTDSIKSITVASQVCNMVWSPHANELVTSHGFSEHQVLRWSYPKLETTAIMTGHQQRVLHLCLSPDGTTAVTGSADQTLRFWPVFSQKAENRKVSRFRNHMIPTNPFFDDEL